jgi:cell division protein FtsZ
MQAFRAANDVLLGAVQGIADLIVRPGLINVDFADVRTVMSEMGLAMMGSGTARGDDRAQAAAEAAISNPLLDEVNLAGANGVLVNITAGPDFTMREFDEVGRIIDEFAAEDATVVVGTVLDPNMQDEVRVTVVATGLNRGAVRQARPDRAEFGSKEPMRNPVKLVRNATTGLPDYDSMLNAEPTHTGYNNLGLRASRGGSDMQPQTALADLPSDQSYLDIPAFLRRQAD